MNDEFLHALRREPPPRFASELKRRLDRQSARSRRSSIVRVVMGVLLIGGVAVAAALLLRSRNEQSDMAQISQAVPAAPTPQAEANPAVTSNQTAVAPGNRVESQAAEPAAAAAPGIAVVTSALARPLAQALLEQVSTPPSSGPRVTVMEANDAFTALCSGTELVLASRRILDAELVRCRNYGIEVVEWKLGYQAVVLTAGPTAEPARLSPREVYLALARRIPDPADPSRLIDNPNATWHDVDARFDSRTIDVLAPADALVRDVFVQLVMEAGCETYPSIRDLKQGNRRRYDEACHQLRSDSHYREVRLGPTFVTQQLWAEPNWLVLLPYSFYDIYRRQLLGTMLAGAEPTLASLDDGTYLAGRPVYAYAASDRLYHNPFMRSITFELSGGFVPYGYLQRAGLILPDSPSRQRPDLQPPAPLKPESLTPTRENSQ